MSRIAPYIGSGSRRGKGRIVTLCNPCRDNEAGPTDKQDLGKTFIPHPLSCIKKTLFTTGTHDCMEAGGRAAQEAKAERTQR